MTDFSFFRGVVENTQDPLKQGRLQVRVPILHGVKDSYASIPTNALPWAESISSADAPPFVNEVVWVLAHKMDVGRILVIGVASSKFGRPKIPNPDVTLVIDGGNAESGGLL